MGFVDKVLISISVVKVKVPQGSQRPIGLMTWNIFVFYPKVVGDIFCLCRFFLIVGHSDPKAYWVNILQMFQQNYPKVLKKYSCLKTVVTIRVKPREYKAGCHKK